MQKMRYERFRMLAVGFSLVVRILVTGFEGEDPTARVVASCRDALGEDACASMSEGGDAHAALEATVLEATVHFSGEEVSVELTRPGAEQTGAEPKRRSLTFLAGDGPEQRLRAAGLLVAAWAASEPRPPVVEPPPVAEIEGRLVAFELLGRRKQLSFDVGVMGGSLWDRGDWAFGGEARATFFWGSPFGLTSAFAVSRAAGVAPAWSKRGSLGGALELVPTGPGVSWWLFVEGVVEHLEVSVAAATTDEARSVARGGGRLESRWAWSDTWCRPWVGIAGGWMAPPVEVELGGRPLIEASGWTVGFAAGLRFELFGGGAGSVGSKRSGAE